MKAEDLTGKKFGRLTVISLAGKKSYGKRTWNCLCSCGEKTVVCHSNLTGRKTKSCGCLFKESLAKRNTKDLSSMRFGMLVAIESIDKDAKGRLQWKCHCDCGNEKVVSSSKLISGTTKSCGCLHGIANRKRLTKHNMCGSKIYSCWVHMKGRCKNKKNSRFATYGGRGITFTKDWESFENFYVWAIKNGYSEGLTLERVDVDGNYTPDNCTWIPFAQQSRNTTRNVYITIDGETKILADWLREYGKKYYQFSRNRLKGLNCLDSFLALISK